MGAVLLLAIAGWYYLGVPTGHGRRAAAARRWHTPRPPAVYRLTQPDGAVPTWAAWLQAAAGVVCLLRIGQRLQRRRHPGAWMLRAAVHGSCWVWAIGTGPMGHDSPGPWPVFASPAWAFAVGGALGILWSPVAVFLVARGRTAVRGWRPVRGLRPPALNSRPLFVIGLLVLALAPWTDARLAPAWTWDPADYARRWLELVGSYLMLAGTVDRSLRERLGELALRREGLRWLPGDLAIGWSGLVVALGLTAAAHWVRTPLANLNVIVPGRLYRSGYPRYHDLVLAQPRLQLRTIINLDGANEEPSWRDERRFVRERGIRYIQTRVTDATPERWAELFADPGAYPMLIHCQQGLHRSTALVAVYRMIEQGWTLDQALAEIERTSGDSTKQPFLGWLEDLDRRKRRTSPMSDDRSARRRSPGVESGHDG